MPYQVMDDTGAGLDAHLDIEGPEIVFHSRGGTGGSAGARNTAYGPALRLVLERLERAGVGIAGAWVDSNRVQHLPLSERSILDAADAGRSPADKFRLLSQRMADLGRPEGSTGGNPTKRIRIRLDHAPSGLPEVLRLRSVERDFRSEERLPAELLSRVTAEHIWSAVLRLADDPNDHPFGPSRDFDLIVDDETRLPPKAVFGLAASDALGFPAGPKHFTGGLGTPCFRALEAAGFEIVPKGAPTRTVPIPMSNEDRDWSEGRPRLVLHLKRERGAGLARAKKDWFIREHGRLFCELCRMDPSSVFGDATGEACIEVHHRDTHVADMGDDHRTKLEDLQCLCANCHRVVHARLKARLGQAGADRP